MTHTAQEDKKLIAMNEAKTRDLKEKISALLNIERVSGESDFLRSFPWLIHRVLYIGRSWMH